MKITVLIASIYVLALEGNLKKLIEIVEKKYSPIRERLITKKKVREGLVQHTVLFHIVKNLFYLPNLTSKTLHHMYTHK